MNISREQLASLSALMRTTGEALFEDCEVNINGNGVSSYDAAKALNAVAEILGIRGPVDVYDLLCDEAAK